MITLCEDYYLFNHNITQVLCYKQDTNISGMIMSVFNILLTIKYAKTHVIITP